MIHSCESSEVRAEYAEALSQTADDEWMRKHFARTAIGTDNFMRQVDNPAQRAGHCFVPP